MMTDSTDVSPPAVKRNRAPCLSGRRMLSHFEVAAKAETPTLD